MSDKYMEAWEYFINGQETGPDPTDPQGLIEGIMVPGSSLSYVEEVVEFTEADYEKLRKYVPQMAIFSGRCEWIRLVPRHLAGDDPEC